MQRREFVAGLGSVAAWPLTAGAQPAERMQRIGVLMPFAADDPQSPARVATFLQGLQQLGWVPGRNLQIDYRWSAGNAARVRQYASELIALKPDLILATGGATMGPLHQIAGMCRSCSSMWSTLSALAS